MAIWYNIIYIFNIIFRFIWRHYCFLSGAVQTGSVMLNAKPTEFRCRNFLDDRFNSSFSDFSFASPAHPCKSYQVDWKNMCPDAKNIQDFQKRTSNIDYFIRYEWPFFLTHKDTDQSDFGILDNLKIWKFETFRKCFRK